MAKPKQPLYVPPHGIEVIGEYAPKGKNKYWRVRIRPHQFFPHVPVVSDGCYVRRSRVVLSAKIGRALLITEIAHHINENKQDDSPDYLEIDSLATHKSTTKSGIIHNAEIT